MFGQTEEPDAYRTFLIRQKLPRPRLIRASGVLPWPRVASETAAWKTAVNIDSTPLILKIGIFSQVAL